MIFDFLVDDQPPQNHLNLIEEAAKLLYGLIHARFIMTNAGIREMAEKWKAGHFEYCPRVYCDYSRMLPIGKTQFIYYLNRFLLFFIILTSTLTVHVGL